MEDLKIKWYNKKPFVIFSVILFWPIGLINALTKSNASNKRAKIIFFSLIGLLLLLVLLTDEKTSDSTSQEINTITDFEEYEVTMLQDGAIRIAKQYLSEFDFSKSGLIERLEYDVLHEYAVYAADNVGVDWNEQAETRAKFYLREGISKNGLLEILEIRGFPHEDVARAIDNIGVDWNEQAERTAKYYLDMYNERAEIDLDMPILTKNDLIEHLNVRGFTSEQITFGVDAIGF